MREKEERRKAERRKTKGRKWIRRLMPAMLCLLLVPAVPCGAAEPELENGEYTVEVTMEGGSGRASVTSPAVLTVEDGSAVVQIEWSSSNYDYMKLGGETYLPVNEEGNSVFELPVEEFDTPVTVVADTTAMSTPHEIEYTFTFESASVTPAGQERGQISGLIVCACICIVAAVCVFCIVRRKRKQKQ